MQAAQCHIPGQVLVAGLEDVALCRSRGVGLSLAPGITHSAVIVPTAWGPGQSQCEAGPCTALVEGAAGTAESSVPYPTRLSHLLTFFDQPYFFPDTLKCVHNCIICWYLHLALGVSPSCSVWVCAFER